LFGHPTHELNAISGLSGGVDPDFGVIDTSLDGTVEPLLGIWLRAAASVRSPPFVSDAAARNKVIKGLESAVRRVWHQWQVWAEAV